MHILVILFVAVFLAISAADWVGDDIDVSKVPKDEDVGLDIVQLVTKRGYPIETHYITTRDGYILTCFRIPHGKNSATVGKPVVLQHGLLDSAYTWTANYESQSLAYILADQGYDIWMNNNRGNRYGRNHTTLNPDDGTDAFWSFTWDDMASEDVPAVVHYVLDQTGQEKLSWVGHSEGTIQIFAAGSLESSDPFFTSAIDRIGVFAALAPVAYVSHMQSKILVALAHSDLIDKFYQRGKYEFLPYGPLDIAAAEICALTEQACNVFLMTICGPTQHINASRIQVYVSNTPAGTSVMNMEHWMQGVLVDKFQKYDYKSPDANQRHYNQSTPPLYDLSKMRVKTALFAGDHDYLADPQDVQRLVAELPAAMVVFQDTLQSYAHLDYTWADDAYKNVYNKVVSVLAKYA
ncbi:alpha/beta fold hydrolase [archaeon]|nr:MAG: alpha/beta fold hydrolase [archaeon]